MIYFGENTTKEEEMFLFEEALKERIMSTCILSERGGYDEYWYADKYLQN